MTPEWATLISAHWPTLTLIAAFLVGIYFIVKALALTFDAVGDALGPIGRAWRARRTISQAEADDMRQRLQYLAEQVRKLRWRDECYFSFCILDAEWHKKHELLAITHGWGLAPHVSFWEFSEKWMSDRGINKETDVWL